MILRALLVLLLLILSSCFGLTFDMPDMPSGGGAAAMPTYHIIEDVDVQVMESVPMQITLHVTGIQPDGCALDVQVDQWREGNDVFVEIYREIPQDMFCPEMIVTYDAMIPLEGGFESGTYTIHVNDYEVEITL
jgi:hypothetical protein